METQLPSTSAAMSAINMAAVSELTEVIPSPTHPLHRQNISNEPRTHFSNLFVAIND